MNEKNYLKKSRTNLCIRSFYGLLNEDAVAYYFILGTSFLSLAAEY